MSLCPEKIQLLAEYNRAVSIHEQSISSWIEAMRLGISRRQNQVDTEEAHQEALAARARLNHHIVEHRCSLMIQYEQLTQPAPDLAA